MKYLGSPHHWPTNALDIVFGLSTYLGIDTFAELDTPQLYIHISSQAKNIKKVLKILSLLVLKQTDMPTTPELHHTK